MSQRGGAPPDILAMVSLSLGAFAVLTVAGCVIWMSLFEGEAVFAPMFYSGIPITVIGGLGVGFGIAGIVRRARPRWMSGTGLALSTLALLAGLYLLIGILMVYIALMNMSSWYH